MKTSEPASTRESTERVVNILGIIYSKSDPEKVVKNGVQLSSEQSKKLLGLLHDFEDLFYVTLDKWDTTPIDLEINP